LEINNLLKNLFSNNIMDNTVVLQYEKSSSEVKIKKKNLNFKNLFLTGNMSNVENISKLYNYNFNITNEIINNDNKKINLSNINFCDIFICLFNSKENEKEIFTYLGAVLVNKEFINPECKIFVVCPNNLKLDYKNDETFNNKSVYHLNSIDQIYEILDKSDIEKTVKIF
tara:strand:+ start:804 stop:1313 length:510 start_codon:yes stop_codon:yes gene_type:complete